MRDNFLQSWSDGFSKSTIEDFHSDKQISSFCFILKIFSNSEYKKNLVNWTQNYLITIPKSYRVMLHLLPSHRWYIYICWNLMVKRAFANWVTVNFSSFLLCSHIEKKPKHVENGLFFLIHNNEHVPLIRLKITVTVSYGTFTVSNFNHALMCSSSEYSLRQEKKWAIEEKEKHWKN